MCFLYQTHEGHISEEWALYQTFEDPKAKFWHKWQMLLEPFLYKLNTDFTRIYCIQLGSEWCKKFNVKSFQT